MIKIYNADCLTKLPQLEEVDAVVTDPPYGLSFMGKEWDHGVPGAPFWEAALGAMKPGAHLLAFGGTRTYHRLACAIEDAGFELRDCIMWVYGTGFPKSHNISKAIDKKLGAKREKTQPGNPPAYQRSIGNTRPWMDDPNHKIDGPDAVTEEARQWDGWGTALKPAWEPIIVARKPFKGTVAGNVLEHGTGGINVDGCRVGAEDMSDQWDRSWKDNSGELGARYSQKGRERGKTVPPGRFPANLIHDGSGACTDGAELS